jgi:putative membrane protein
VESGGSFEDRDASRRTRLANERTFLAWWRSGITALGVSVAVGRIVPEIGHHTRWPYAVLGSLYAVFGIAMVAYGSVRQREVEKGIERGVHITTDRRALSAFTAMGVVIGVGTLALVVAGA